MKIDPQLRAGAVTNGVALQDENLVCHELRVSLLSHPLTDRTTPAVVPAHRCGRCCVTSTCRFAASQGSPTSAAATPQRPLSRRRRSAAPRRGPRASPKRASPGACPPSPPTSSRRTSPLKRRGSRSRRAPSSLASIGPRWRCVPCTSTGSLTPAATPHISSRRTPYHTIPPVRLRHLPPPALSDQPSPLPTLYPLACQTRGTWQVAVQHALALGMPGATYHLAGGARDLHECEPLRRRAASGGRSPPPRCSQVHISVPVARQHGFRTLLGMLKKRAFRTESDLIAWR
jgi:hypothetical protein